MVEGELIPEDLDLSTFLRPEREWAPERPGETQGRCRPGSPAWGRWMDSHLQDNAPRSCSFMEGSYAMTHICRLGQAGTEISATRTLALTLRHSSSTMCPWDAIMSKTQAGPREGTGCWERHGSSQRWEGRSQGCGLQRKHVTLPREALGKAFQPGPECNNTNYYL